LNQTKKIPPWDKRDKARLPRWRGLLDSTA
jgi:hypothetical protein